MTSLKQLLPSHRTRQRPGWRGQKALAFRPRTIGATRQGNLGWAMRHINSLYTQRDNRLRTPLAAGIVMLEVIVGYLMLGILISILATKVARRS